MPSDADLSTTPFPLRYILLHARPALLQPSAKSGISVHSACPTRAAATRGVTFPSKSIPHLSNCSHTHPAISPYSNQHIFHSLKRISATNVQRNNVGLHHRALPVHLHARPHSHPPYRNKCRVRLPSNGASPPSPCNV